MKRQVLLVGAICILYVAGIRGDHDYTSTISQSTLPYAPTNQMNSPYTVTDNHVNNNYFIINFLDSALLDRLGVFISGTGSSLLHVGHASVLTLSDWTVLTGRLLLNHKWSCLGVGLVTAYGALWYSSWSVKGQLLDRTRWFYWKESLTLDRLFACDQKELARELVLAIEQRYAVADNPADFVTPISSFLHEISHESALMDRYALLGLWMNRLHLMWLMGFDQQLLELSVEWRHRIAYLKALLIQWLADHPLAKHARSNRLEIDLKQVADRARILMD